MIKENEKREDITTKEKLLKVKNVVFKMKNLRLNIRLNILQRELVNWVTDLRKSYKCSAKYKETENMWRKLWDMEDCVYVIGVPRGENWENFGE